MRQLFFMGILLGGVLAAVVYLIWVILKAVHYNWTLTRGVADLERTAAERRQAKQNRQAARLDNGCDHDFDTAPGGFPPRTCYKCGLERDRPSGPCDHLWQLAEGPMLSSVCQHCGKRYTSSNLSL